MEEEEEEEAARREERRSGFDTMPTDVVVRWKRGNAKFGGRGKEIRTHYWAVASKGTISCRGNLCIQPSLSIPEFRTDR